MRIIHGTKIGLRPMLKKRNKNPFLFGFKPPTGFVGG